VRKDLLLATALLAAGCKAPEPTPVYTVTAEVESLAAGSVGFAAAGPDTGFVAVADGALLVRGPLDEAAMDLGATTGAVRAAAWLPSGAVLLAADEGFFVIQGDDLQASPLDDLLDAAGVTALLSAGDDLWLVDGDALLLWRGDFLYEVAPGALPVAGALLAWGAPADGVASLWIAAGGQLWALVPDTGAAGAPVFAGRVELDDAPATGLGVDALGNLWLAGADGSLRRRVADGERWETIPLETPIVSITASPAALDVWLAAAGELIHQKNDLYYNFSNAPAPAPGAALAVDPAGRLLVPGPAGLDRVSTGRPVVFLGLPDGSRLDVVTTVDLAPSLAARVVSIVATLDGAPVDVTPDPYHVVLDPLALADGAHELDVTAVYDDTVPKPCDSVQGDNCHDGHGSLAFTVGLFEAPTWAADIEPIHAASCNLCHGPDGKAHLMDTPASWQAQIDRIIELVTSGDMPRTGDRLTPEEIGKITGWRAGGFLE
jgi:hypothetical protein